MDATAIAFLMLSVAFGAMAALSSAWKRRYERAVAAHRITQEQLAAMRRSKLPLFSAYMGDRPWPGDRPLDPSKDEPREW